MRGTALAWHLLRVRCLGRGRLTARRRAAHGRVDRTEPDRAAGAASVPRRTVPGGTGLARAMSAVKIWVGGSDLVRTMKLATVMLAACMGAAGPASSATILATQDFEDNTTTDGFLTGAELGTDPGTFFDGTGLGWTVSGDPQEGTNADADLIGVVSATSPVSLGSRSLSLPAGNQWFNFDDADLAPITRSFYMDNRRVKNDKIKNELGRLFLRFLAKTIYLLLQFLLFSGILGRPVLLEHVA